MTGQLADPAGATLTSSLRRRPESERKYRSMTPPKVALITGVTGQNVAHASQPNHASDRHEIPVNLGSRIAARFAGIGLSGELPQRQGQAAAPMGFDA